MERDLKGFSENYDLSYYTNEKNIRNQDLVRETIWYFENTDAQDVFKPLEFLNLFEKQYQFVKFNFIDSEKVIQHLKSLPLNDREKHILYGFILKWFGGYPVNNANDDLNATLSLIETEFLAFPGYSDEKHYCKSDMDKQKKFMRLGEAATVSIRYGLDMNKVFAALNNSDQSKTKAYSNFYELFEDAVKNGSIKEPEHDFIVQISSYKIQFNEWLLENKGWNCREDDNYKQLLTKENWIEFLYFQKELKADRQKKYEAEKQSWQLKQQPGGNGKDIVQLIIEQTEIHDFLSVPAPDVLHENAFWHDENDLPIDCNIYHPKYGYKGFETTTKEPIVTSFQPVTIYTDERSGKYIYCQYYRPMLCTADEVNFTSKDSEKVIKVNWTQTNQKRLAENEDDFTTICQREFERQKLIETPETKRRFYLELIKHTKELIELHERRSSYKEGRDINVLGLADRFIEHLTNKIEKGFFESSKPQNLQEIFPKMESKVSTMSDAIRELNITKDLSERQITGFIDGCKKADALPQIENTVLLRVIYNEIGKEYTNKTKPRYDTNAYAEMLYKTKKYFGIK